MNAVGLLRCYERFADAPDAVDKLRQLVLELAVTGKLIQSVGFEQPASKKQNDPLEETSKEGLPYGQLPEGWAWRRLCELGVLSGGMTPAMSKSEYWGGDVVWLSPKDIKSDEVASSELKITTKGLTETRLQLYPARSLFMVARSGILKRTFPVAINTTPAAANQDMKVLVPFIGGQERYLQIMFRGFKQFILKKLVKTGTTVQSLKYAEFEQQLFPIPSVEEQKRIVAKVDELMALCDQLEAARVKREASPVNSETKARGMSTSALLRHCALTCSSSVGVLGGAL